MLVLSGPIAVPLDGEVPSGLGLAPRADVDPGLDYAKWCSLFHWTSCRGVYKSTDQKTFYLSVYESAIAAAGCQSLAMRLSPDAINRGIDGSPPTVIQS